PAPTFGYAVNSEANVVSSPAPILGSVSCPIEIDDDVNIDEDSDNESYYTARSMSPVEVIALH
ncbi:hypothetical protein DFQ30_004625, partial [Apophysomyces sp. BC1015]